MHIYICIFWATKKYFHEIRKKQTLIEYIVIYDISEFLKTLCTFQ